MRQPQTRRSSSVRRCLLCRRMLPQQIDSGRVASRVAFVASQRNSATVRAQFRCRLHALPNRCHDVVRGAAGRSGLEEVPAGHEQRLQR